MISTETPKEEASNPPKNPTAGAPVEIEVLLSGVTFGPFTEAKVRERLEENLLALTDLARFSSSEEWRPLQDVLEDMPPAPEPVSEPEPEPQPTKEEAAPKSLPRIIARFPTQASVQPEASPNSKESEPPAPPDPVKPPTAKVDPEPPAADNPPSATPALEEPSSKETSTSVLPRRVPTAALIAPVARPFEGSFKTQSSIGTGPLPAPPRQTFNLARPGQKSATSAILRPNSARQPTKTLGGIRSQILARTANELPTLVKPGVPRTSTLSMTAPLSLKSSILKSTKVTPPAAPAPEPAPAAAPIPTPVTPAPASEPASIPLPGAAALKAPLSAARTFRFPTSRPNLDEGENIAQTTPVPVSAAILPVVAAEVAEEVEAPVKPPVEPPVETPPEAIKTPAAPESPALGENPSSAEISPPAEVTPAEDIAPPPVSPEIPEAAPATPRLTFPTPLASGSLPPPPAKPIEKRPPASIDSILTVRLPARRTQVIKALPGAAVAKGSETNPIDLKNLPVPPIRSAPKSAANPVRRGMAKTSALAATTLLNPAGKRASAFPVPNKKEPAQSPLVMPAASSAPAEFSSLPSPAPETPTEDSDRLSNVTPLVETRRAALRQARERRRRQGIAYAVLGALLFVTLCAGIYHYVSANREVEKTLPGIQPPAPTSEKPAPNSPGATAPPPNSAPSTVPGPTSTPSNPLTPPSSPGPATTPAAPTTDAAAPAAVITPVAPPDPKVLAHVTAGQAAQAKGDFDTAIGEFTQALILDPKFVQGYGYRAAADQAKGDLDSAISDINQLLTLDPSNANGFCQRGFLKQAEKDSDGALADYGRAIQLDPKSFVALYNRGMIEEQKGQPDAAIADYNQTIELNPHLAGAFYNRGNAKMDKLDRDGAIADYTTALQINPKIALAFCNRAMAEQDQGNLDSALTDYNQSLALNPNIEVAYYNRGLIEEQRGNLDGCVDDSTKAIDLAPDDANAFYNRGVALQAKGNLDSAAMDLRKFNDLGPKSLFADYARLYLWVITSLQNHKDQANRDLAASLDSNWNAEPAQLPSKIAAFLLDRLPEPDLLALASSPDLNKDKSQHCEILYFDGMKKMITGDKSGAIDAFHKCLDTGETNFCEYILAQAELNTLSPS